MPDQRIDLGMLTRVDAEQKETALRVGAVEQTLHKLEVEVGEIRGSLKSAKAPWWVTAIIAPLCVAAILGTVGAVIDLEITVNRIEWTQTKQVMGSISAQAVLLKNEGKLPSQDAVQQLASASTIVTAAINRYPKSSEVWKAASSLVNVRSLNSTKPVEIPADILEAIGSPVPNGGDCFKLSIPSSFPHMPPSWNGVTAWLLHAQTHDCTMYLDDLEDFKNSTLMGYVNKHRDPNFKGSVLIELALVRVHVVYRGGPVIPISAIKCYDCTFDFDVPSAPSQRGRGLLESILSQNPDTPTLDIKVPVA